jgi:hypothetical protein
MWQLMQCCAATAMPGGCCTNLAHYLAQQGGTM